MLKKILIVCMLLALLFGNSIVLGYEEEDVEVEEELAEEEFDGIVQSAVAEAPNVPNINSRHAVIYDRATR